MARVHIAAQKEKVNRQYLPLPFLPNLQYMKVDATPQETLTIQRGTLDADLSNQDPDHLSLDRDELFHSGADVAVVNFVISLTTIILLTNPTSVHGTITICNGHQRTK